MDVARKKFQKSHKPASGRVDSFSDELGQAIMTGGRGFGTRGGIGKSKGQGVPDRESAVKQPIRPKVQPKTDSAYIRKPKIK